MPFIYLTGFILCLALNIIYPELTRLLSVIEVVCLGGVIVFSLLELRLMAKATKSRNLAQVSHPENNSL